MKHQLTTMILAACIPVFGVWGLAAHAQSLDRNIHASNKAITAYSEEIESLRARRSEVEGTLDDYQSDLAERDRTLMFALKRASNSPSPENELEIDSEERQIELIELKIKSRVAMIVRLETKEQELTGKLKASQRRLERLEATAQRKKASKRKSSSAPKVRPVASNLSQVNSKTLSAPAKPSSNLALKKQLEALKAENERLRSLAQTKAKVIPAAPRVEAKKTPTVSSLPAVVSKTVTDQPSARKRFLRPPKPMTEEQLSALAVVKTVQENVLAAQGQSIKAKELKLKGNGVALHSLFEHLGGHQYRSQAVVRSGKNLRFDVGDRRFKYQIPEEDAGEMYVFFYDLSDESSPKFFAFRRSLLDDSVWRPEKVVADN